MNSGAADWNLIEWRWIFQKKWMRSNDTSGLRYKNTSRDQLFPLKICGIVKICGDSLLRHATLYFQVFINPSFVFYR